MAQSNQNRKESAKPGKDRKPVANRPWHWSVAWSAVMIAGLLVLAVVVNMIAGRVIHWNIVTGLGVLGFVFLSVGRRYRTI